MTELLDRLHKDHEALSRVLDLFTDLLDEFHQGGEPDYELMREMLEYMETYSDQVHHPSEEDIFDRVRARAHESVPVLDRLTEQHQLLGEMNRRFRRSLDGIVHEEVLRRDEVEAQGRELVKTLREHLDLEETEAFPLAQERLSASDWDELHPPVQRDEDPLFSAQDRTRFQTLYRHLVGKGQN